MIGYTIGAIIGALAITYLMSRLMLWLLKRVSDRRARCLWAHGLAYLLAAILGGLGYADGGPPKFLYAASLYLLPTIMWLVIDLRKR